MSGLSIPAANSYSSVRFVERDLSQIFAPLGALGFGGLFSATNGPADDIIMLSDEATLAGLYGKPNENNFVEWFNIARAFKYKSGSIGATAKIVRVIGTGCLNGALGVTNTALVNASDLTTMLIRNDDDAVNPTVVFDEHTLANSGDGSVTKLKFFSKYPTTEAYKIALCKASDFATAEIFDGVKFANTFTEIPEGTEVAIAVVYENEVVEQFIVDITRGNVDGFGEPNYIENVINDGSQYILCYDNESLSGIPASFEATALTKGVNVLPTNADYITALSLYEDINSVDINYMLGNNKVIGEMMTLCENRLDCQLIWSASPSLVINKTSITAVSNLVDYTSTTMNRNSTYAEFFGNAALITDTYNNKTRWVELAGDLVGLRILKNLTGNQWEASAGLNYGQIRDILKLAFNPTDSQMNEMGKNKINPVIAKYGKGNVSWGVANYTTKKSSLSDSTTRGLVISIWRASRDTLSYQLFQINDSITRNNIKTKLDQYMRSVQSARGVYDFLVDTSEKVNTPQVIDNGQLVVLLKIKPTRLVKELILYVTLHSSGADLTVE